MKWIVPRVTIGEVQIPSIISIPRRALIWRGFSVNGVSCQVKIIGFASTELTKRPLETRLNCPAALAYQWPTDGFSVVDRIDFGEQANMHAHVLNDQRHKANYETSYVLLSAAL